jgi:hypothetical protein
MKYAICIIAAAVVAGASVFLVMRHQTRSSQMISAADELASLRQTVEKRLGEITSDIDGRLAAFAGEVSTDQQFSLKLLVENNVSAPEVTGTAARFLGPMGFSLLAVADSAGIILSSGHFPASAGNSMASTLSRLSATPAVIEDNVMGRQVLTMQAKKTFSIAGDIRFSAVGGLIVDDRFLETLSPRPGVSVLFKQGATVTGMAKVQAISEVKNNRIIINDREYPAFELPLEYAGDSLPPVLIVAVTKPGT